MGRMIAEHDWSESPLGPIDGWPDALADAVEVILHSSFQLAIYWGPELVLLYNDAERVTLGEMHPEALGQPARVVLADVWDEVGAMLEGVLETGRPTWSEDAPLALRRGPAAEEAFFTWSYSPLFGDSGRPEGVLLVSVETTRRVLGERRLVTLHALAKETSQPRALPDVWEHTVSAVLADEDIVCAELHLVSEESTTRVASAGVSEWHRVDGLDPGAIAACAARGRTRVRRLAADVLGGTTVVMVPLNVRSLPAVTPVLVLGFNPLRLISRAERNYARLLGNQIAAAANDACVLERERITLHDEAVVEERHRIERDMHDSIQRQLIAARLLVQETRQLAISDPVQAAGLLDELSEQLSSASKEVRGIVAGTHPAPLSGRGLRAAIAAAAAGLQVTLDGDVARFDPAGERELYYAVVEAIQNALKHAGPTARVGVRLRQAGDTVVAVVHDSGVGFDLARVRDGSGMQNMQARLASVGGTLAVRSFIGRGTVVRCKCPRVPTR